MIFVRFPGGKKLVTVSTGVGQGTREMFAFNMIYHMMPSPRTNNIKRCTPLVWKINLKIMKWKTELIFLNNESGTDIFVLSLFKKKK